jgi:6-phosphogluconolactonase (cycloisomerase 2 family)
MSRHSLMGASRLSIGVALGLFIATSAHSEGRYLYIESNAVEEGQNAIIGYERLANGAIAPLAAGAFPTRGTGLNNDTNGKLGPNDNDTPIIADANGRRLFAVNGHSNTIAVFDIQSDGSLSHVPGSPFSSKGIHPSSLSLSGDTLLVANRNEDPNQLEALRGGAVANYASFEVMGNGSLHHASTIEMPDGHKPTQVLVSPTNPNIAFGNDFQVDVDFDGEGAVSRLFGTEPQVRGRIQSFAISSHGMLSKLDAEALPETVMPAPDVPTVPLGIWAHPSENLLYAGFVTRNELGIYRYDNDGDLSFVRSVPNSGQDICWLRINADGTRLFAVNNLPREDQNDSAGTITVFDISGENAERPIELDRIELPMPSGTFVNNRNAAQPNSTPFQLDLSEDGKHIYVINQRINQTPSNTEDKGNVLHVLSVAEDGTLAMVQSRQLKSDGVRPTARPQGVIAVSLD